ncbi:PREDICTED: aldehyde dehydrogenase family 3 member B1-like, partial [Prunus mume]|uniref:Aldehyde dehydrogenase family 3 member B1-like n=1 Tax=Prunus mume TaxID=102107 RepID=A0ABM0PXQ4_PRUMU
MKSLCIDLFKNCSATSLAGTRSSRVLTYRFQRTNYQTHLPSTKLTFSSYSTKTCFATLSTVTSEVEEKQTFNPDKAGELVKELRNSFNSGRTKSYEWRMSQLENIAKMLEEKEKEITEALYKDLSKPEVEAFISECLFISYTTIVNLKSKTKVYSRGYWDTDLVSVNVIPQLC